MAKKCICTLVISSHNEKQLWPRYTTRHQLCWPTVLTFLTHNMLANKKMSEYQRTMSADDVSRVSASMLHGLSLSASSVSRYNNVKMTTDVVGRQWRPMWCGLKCFHRVSKTDMLTLDGLYRKRWLSFVDNMSSWAEESFTSWCLLSNMAFIEISRLNFFWSLTFFWQLLMCIELLKVEYYLSLSDFYWMFV